jgi:dipeptidyl aminopeptidase/acylaminoacyl peptidase
MAAVVRIMLACCLLPGAAPLVPAQGRPIRPEDLFRVERVGGIAWSPDSARAAVQIHRPPRWLDSRSPSAEIHVVDVASASMRRVASPSSEIIGCFGAVWSPDGRHLLMLSVDTNAVVRPWIWTVGADSASLLRGIELADRSADPPYALWTDSDHVILTVRDTDAPPEGPLYLAIQRGRNVAVAWRRAREGREAAASVLESRGAARSGDTITSSTGNARIVSVDVHTGIVTELARGPVHRPSLSADRRTLSYYVEDPPAHTAPVASFFGPDALGEAAYDKVNWGDAVRYVDSRSGAPVAPDTSRRRVEVPPRSLRATRSQNGGTRLLLARPSQPEIELWRGNEWAREISTGRVEAISYRSTSGEPLIGWLLYPPSHVAGRRLPIVTVVYPGTAFDEQTPESFDILYPHFEHPQLLAALGYGVVLPSMPEAENPLRSDALGSLTAGVLPLLDTLVARGIADPNRVAVLGQSAGGWATLGLITRTNRFRTAIASASYSNLVSLYGTFYGQYRYGDGGHPQRAQLLRMLQLERGYFGADAPPWEEPERYRVNSPIVDVARVETPLLLVHGELDFIPVQQAEEFFTALYRQDKRVRLLRYAGEGHTIAARANVLDLWRRLEEWLRETMPLDPPDRRGGLAKD